MDDLIYRSAALKSLGEPPLVWTESDYEIGMNVQWTRDFNAIKNVPPARSDVPDMNAGDIISRQAAIDALDQIFDRCEEIEAHLPEGDPDRTGYKMYPDYMTVWKYLHQLLTAQPEVIQCKDCEWWEKQKDSLQGRCELMQMYPTGEWYCGNAQRRVTDGRPNQQTGGA